MGEVVLSTLKNRTVLAVIWLFLRLQDSLYNPWNVFANGLNGRFGVFNQCLGPAALPILSAHPETFQLLNPKP